MSQDVRLKVEKVGERRYAVSVRCNCRNCGGWRQIGGWDGVESGKPWAYVPTPPDLFVLLQGKIKVMPLEELRALRESWKTVRELEHLEGEEYDW